MKCPRCNGNSDYYQKVIIDGVEKLIVFCKKCVVETLKYDVAEYTKAGIELLNAHTNFAEEIFSNSNNFTKNTLEILTLMPLAVQTVLFKGDELTKLRLTKDINSRQIYFLQQRLKKALASENYQLANILKKQIERLQNLTEI
ncbi:hypothetical protein JYK00_06150 [Thermosipho ferrireducens]|uniref:UVR domain-containing protein n=1 Tax=Thermosipho ferrireducens TaxID=2571116 RepID=A0ABX7S885_9BACT|nr:hypothetical protein [Thermosipho ferrireducens]QTA37320.1 hypothetical protein JYK00_06150 [Thermosipho ferrireducens]